MKIKPFFSSDENRNMIAKSISELDKISRSEEDSEPQIPDLQYLDSKKEFLNFSKDRNESIRTILRVMLGAPNEWDKNCKYSINKIGDKFITRLSKLTKASSKEELDMIFAICYRFLIEFYLSVQEEFDIEFERIRTLAINQIEYFEKLAQEQIRYSAYSLPIEIFKSAFNDDNVVNIRNFNQIYEVSDLKLNQWKEEIKQSEERVDQLKLILENHKTAFNFVGLFDGFNGLSIVKERERAVLVKWIRIAGLAIF